MLGQIENNNIDLDKSGWLIQAFVFEKLPIHTCELFQMKANTVYPTLKQIRDLFTMVLSLYQTQKEGNSEASATKNKFNGNANYSKPQNKNYQYQKGKKTYTNNSKPETKENLEKKSSLQNFNVNTETNNTYQTVCKFCSSESHSTTRCTKYFGVQARRNRCNQLNLCQRCTGPGHAKSECKTRLKFSCKNCKSQDHVIALCDKFGETDQNTSSQVPPPQKKSTPTNSSGNAVNTGNLCLASASKNSTVLLPTITLDISDADGNIQQSKKLN